MLRDRIAGGEPADVFASANMEHPEALVRLGWADAVRPFARNQMCVLAQPSVPLTTDGAQEVMLAAQWKLGTSTPKADPAGDYAWEVFERAERVRPGAFATWSAKALTLTGGPQSPAPPANRYARGPNGPATAPRGSLQAEVFEIAGARNVAEPPPGFASNLFTVSLEQVLQWQPDVIVTIDAAFAAAVRVTAVDGVRRVFPVMR